MRLVPTTGWNEPEETGPPRAFAATLRLLRSLEGPQNLAAANPVRDRVTASSRQRTSGHRSP